MTSEYNTTHLDPKSTFERHVFHRDMFAHFLRWTYVLGQAKIGMKILDFGCATGNLAEVFYRNRYKPKLYYGLDIRPQTIKKANEKFAKQDFIKFDQADLCNASLDVGNDWDIITSFEVIEHIGKQNADKYLLNVKKHMNEKTMFLLSTPVFDPQVGAADNHIINGEIGEFTFNELYDLLSKYFHIEKAYGTFASQKDYKKQLSKKDLEFFNRLNEYYDSNLVSVIIAPLVKPWEARNCLWRLKLK